MQKIKYISLLAVLAVLVTACSEKKADNKLSVRVSFIMGTVQKISGADSVPLTIGMALAENDIVKTSDDGVCDLIVGEGSKVRIKEKSELKISQLVKNGSVEQTQLDLAVGKVLVNPKKLEKGDSFRIATPTAVAGVRGTKFMVGAEEDGSTQVAVTEGKVAMKKRIPALENASEQAVNSSEILSEVKDKLEAETVVDANTAAAVSNEEVQKVSAKVETLVVAVEKAVEEAGQTAPNQNAEPAVQAEELKAKVDELVKESMKESYSLSAENNVAATIVDKIEETVPVEVKVVAISETPMAKEEIKELEELKVEKKDLEMIKAAEKQAKAEEEAKEESMSEEAWSKQVSQGSIQSSPVLYQDNLIFGDSQGNILAINRFNGKLVWSLPTGASVNSSAAIYENVVYIGSGNENLFAVAADSGKLLWKTPVGNMVFGSKPHADETGIYTGSVRGKIVALNKNGKTMWERNIPAGIFSSVYVAGNKLFAGAQDNKLYALDRKSGNVVWKFETGKRIMGSAPLVNNGVVYVGSSDKRLYALDADSGNQKWAFKAGSSINSNPVLAEGSLLVTASGGQIYRLNAADGSLMWESNVNTSLQSEARVAGSAVFVAAGNSIFKLDLKNGKLQKEYKVASAIYGAPIVKDNGIYVTLASGEMTSVKP